jgi:hypothetical protein
MGGERFAGQELIATPELFPELGKPGGHAGHHPGGAQAASRVPAPSEKLSHPVPERRSLGMSRSGTAVLIFILAAGGLSAQQGKKPPPPSARPIKDIMLGSHKEKGALVFRVRDAESTDDDNKKLLGEYKSLADLKPPLGDVGAWKKRVGNAVAALQELVDKKPGAVERVRSATDCAACHNAHRVGGNK